MEGFPSLEGILLLLFAGSNFAQTRFQIPFSTECRLTLLLLCMFDDPDRLIIIFQKSASRSLADQLGCAPPAAESNCSSNVFLW